MPNPFVVMSEGYNPMKEKRGEYKRREGYMRKRRDFIITRQQKVEEVRAGKGKISLCEDGLRCRGRPSLRDDRRELAL